MRRPEPDQAWRITCGPMEFDALRENAAFHRVLDLARYVNQLYYAMSAVMPYIDEDTPTAHRQRINTFFLFGGVLFEAFGLVPELRVHFGGHAGWTDTLGVYGTDEEIRARLKQGGDLHRIRNHTAYHMLNIVAPGSLKRLALDTYVFVSGQGLKAGHVYYDLADTVATHWASGAPVSGPPFLAEMERVATETRNLALDFARRAQSLIQRTLNGFGFHMELQVGDHWEAGQLPVPAGYQAADD